jgi:hypothetical protein
MANWILPLCIVAILAPICIVLFGWLVGWWRVFRMFGRAPQPSAWVAKWACCIVGSVRVLLHIGASGSGLVISPPFPISLLLPRIWAPWTDISLGGPSWFNREDVSIRGLTIAVPPPVANYVREMQRAHGL